MSNIGPELKSAILDAMHAAELLDSPESRAARAEADRRAALATEKSKAAEWRDNLRKYAPIPTWEKAWEAGATHSVQTVDTWFAEGCKKHLWLFGPVGCGKTISAAHAVKRWVEPGTFEGDNPVSWLRPAQLVSAVFHAYDSQAPKLARRVVIEDVGYRKLPEDFEDAMCDLLDRQGMTIIVTSNMTTLEFRERFKELRFLDRLGDTSMAVRLKGESLRSKGGGF